jgi:hypothetical protein
MVNQKKRLIIKKSENMRKIRKKTRKRDTTHEYECKMLLARRKTLKKKQNTVLKWKHN